MFDHAIGFFYDAWSVGASSKRIESHFTIRPLVFGIASEEQAARVIDEHLLNPKRLFSKHPIWTIVPSIRGFEMLTWRGPAWNSMTYWAARGCVRYGRRDAARKLLESALEATAVQFLRSGTIWEFYDLTGGRPEDLKRETTPPFQIPRKDYTRHNPLFAMAGLLSALVTTQGQPSRGASGLEPTCQQQSAEVMKSRIAAEEVSVETHEAAGI